MKDLTPRERWDVWMVQAQRFARRENYIDALGRLRLVLREVDEAVAAEADPAAKKKLERFRHRVARRRDRIREKFETWNAAIAARRAQNTADAEQEMKRPLPLGPDEHI
ncbi:MAG TPA: hypothetical protein RMH85_09485 [Polyangiaceae bacterium LLY-WYZ-15_(1-7)]|nr:hypothetical protein [Sandaracinus sp.]HJL01679.1 hypothetical protein [Polyangiaceae bacterium LLY-WYZ-15_(1-7)]HJL08719.1 hypothetical protein [Polyangiaceae bacterium LLY-WYZ-15_(1-7)]HJL36440.1 hypothetical protein [Polyangiaceae bacterium LLY-WYZ-15_(1-7)]HJL47189.1 hypothetical protein [Polyangiaceae bacterium LLY-WYZ-15_(1-7)]